MLIGRLKLGREEYCQRLLTMLIIGAPYPRWNTLSSVSPKGRMFLEALDELSFGSSAWSDGASFIDEFDMPRRHEFERGCAPDYALLSGNRLWLIELKTEKSSHRRDQIPSYFEFACHYYPHHAVDITYLTPPMKTATTPSNLPGRFAHVDWDAVAKIVDRIWSDVSDATERERSAALLDSLARLATEKPAEWRKRLLGDLPEEQNAPAAPSLVQISETPEGAQAAAESRVTEVQLEESVLDEAIKLARLTTQDHKQRAVAQMPSCLEELQEWRMMVRQILADSTEDSNLRHVLPWLWSASSGGNPLTQGAREVGYELRLSWYAKSLYS